MTRLGIIFVCVLLLDVPSMHGQMALPVEPVTTALTASPSARPEEYPWEDHVFLAAGYGYVQGFRAELGWNIERYAVLGITFGIGDFWSRDPGEGTIGVIVGFHLPISSFRLCTPYVLMGTGGTVNIMGSRGDTYSFINVGGIIPITGRLMLRPELSFAFTSRAVYDWPRKDTYRMEQYPGANLVLEFDL